MMNYGVNNLYTRPAMDNANTPIADQRLTVDATAGGVQFTPYTPAQCTTVELDIQTADAMCTFDGSAPTTTNGHQLHAGTAFTWSVGRFNAAKFIRLTSTSAVIHASPSQV